MSASSNYSSLRPLASRLLFLTALALASSCASGADKNTGDAGPRDLGSGNSGLKVGSPCTSASQCESPTTAACLTSLKPLSTVAGVPSDIAAFGLDFPAGYCSSEPSCQSNAECGTGGTCFAPFTQVAPDILRTLEMTFNPPITTGSLDFLTTYGVCLATCTTANDCQTGFTCQRPLADLVALVPGSINTQDYCVPDAACAACDVNANCDSSNGTAVCVCKPGYTGNGTTCTPVTDAGMSTATRTVGSRCTSASECISGGVAVCLSDLKPVQNVPNIGPDIGNFGLTFPAGYCSTQLNCTSNLQCDPSGLGYCLQPFRNVLPTTLRTLEMSLQPALPPNSLDFLPDYAVCMRRCTNSLECEPDQSCDYPLAELISLVPDSVNTQRLCVPNDGCVGCTDAHAFCDTSTSTTGVGTCKCEPGWNDLPGAGTVCTKLTVNPCTSNPCLNGGACTDTGSGTFTCNCSATGGFTGQYCEVPPSTNPCSTTPCQHGGVCSPTGTGGFTCNCTGTGYTGSQCETAAVDPCSPSPCLNGGTCTASGSMAVCDCPLGFDGTNCGNNINDCASSPCQNGGTCVDLVNAYMCNCQPGWSGTTCTTPLTTCSPNPCQNGGSCSISGSTITCSCVGGWGGATCTTDQDECTLGTSNCASTATCNNTPGSFTCSCNAGYTGTGVTCTDINECTSGGSNCSANATCNNTPGSFVCACNAGYTGNGVTCTDVNECTSGGANCSTNANCTNTQGGFTCACAAGYSGNGTTCTDDNECALGTANCSANATCANTPGSYTCTCGSGYTGDGVTCTDINECTSGGSNCSANATCANTPGSFTCACSAGFTGNGVTCTDINECTGGTANCAAIATCTNTQGSYMCACPTGYSGNGVSCADIDECATNADNCSPNAACTNTLGSFTCACSAGYSGDGVTCNDVDECAAGVCDPGMTITGETCTNSPGSYTCGCPGGYSFNGTTCVVMDRCVTNNTCSPNATCVDSGGPSITCTCNAGYTGNGTTCTDVNECTAGTSNCSGNATCTNTPGSFTCACNAGFTGDGVTCSDINECATGMSNCSGNATCTNTPGSFMCSCNTGYSGDGVTCTDVNECTSGGSNCGANATCANTPGSFTCSCNTGYTGNGVTCTDINECTSGGSNCSANATCANTPGSFTCSCNTGYTGNGVTCTDVNECTSGGSNCSANATCANTPGSFTCSCNTGYTGNGVTCSPVDCMSLPNPTDGTVSTPNGTTYNQTATYACNSGFTLSGTATRTCQSSGSWSGTAPTCVAAADPCTPNPCLNGGTCAPNGASYICNCADGYGGTTCESLFYCDVVYRMAGTLAVDQTPLNAGNGSDTDWTNASAPPFRTAGRTTPFQPTPYSKAYSRLRFPGRQSSNTPVAGTVGIVEWFIPIEFSISAILGGTTTQNVDQSAGILTGSPVGTCTSLVTTTATYPCLSGNPTDFRPCNMVNSGTVAGTTLTWGACGITPSGTDTWRTWNSQDTGAIDPGCLADYTVWGTVYPFNTQSNNDNRNDQNAIFDQPLQPITFSSTNYATATWSMGYFQVPNGGQSRTRVSVTTATPFVVECGVAGSLTCNEECNASGCAP